MLFYACYAEINALFSPVGQFVSRKSLSLRQAARLRFVTVGLMDYTSAEITSGLQAGEIVTTGIVETK